MGAALCARPRANVTVEPEPGAAYAGTTPTSGSSPNTRSRLGAWVVAGCSVRGFDQERPVPRIVLPGPRHFASSKLRIDKLTDARSHLVPGESMWTLGTRSTAASASIAGSAFTLPEEVRLAPLSGSVAGVQLVSQATAPSLTAGGHASRYRSFSNPPPLCSVQEVPVGPRAGRRMPSIDDETPPDTQSNLSRHPQRRASHPVSANPLVLDAEWVVSERGVGSSVRSAVSLAGTVVDVHCLSRASVGLDMLGSARGSSQA